MSDEKKQLTWLDSEAILAKEAMSPLKKFTLGDETGTLSLRSNGPGESYFVLYSKDGVGRAIPNIAASALYDKAAHNWLLENFDVVDVRSDEEGDSLTVLNYFPPDSEEGAEASNPAINYDTFISANEVDATTNFIVILNQFYKKELARLKKLGQEKTGKTYSDSNEYDLSYFRLLLERLEHEEQAAGEPKEEATGWFADMLREDKETRENDSED